MNVRLDAQTLAKALDVSIAEIETYLQTVKHCHMLAMVDDNELVVLLPKPDSAAVVEANALYAQFEAEKAKG